MDTMAVGEKSPSPSTLRRRHLKFKAHAAEVLLREATNRGPCAVFEQCMVKVGLDAIRPTHDYSGHYRNQVRVVGESTAESFERWKRRTERYLMLMAVDHGYTMETHRAILREAGFRTEKPQLVTVKVVATLEVPTRVRVFKDDGEAEVRKQITDDQVRALLYQRYQNQRGKIEWEVVRSDG